MGAENLPDEDDVPPLTDRLLKGSALMIAMRWSVRLLGLASTAILARLLLPEDFGVIGLAIILVEFVQSVTDVGTVMALIQNTKADRRHYDSAWTLQIFQSLLVAAVVLACAPFSGDFFGDDRVASVLYLSALGMVLQGFTNIGIADFRKKLQFEKDFMYTAGNRVARAIVTIGLAFALKSYWAIAIGNLAGTIIEVWLSYVMSKYRPRFSTSKIRELWSFSQWMLAINSMNFLLERGERFIVGRLVNSTKFGYYAVGYDLAMMPTFEIVMPVIRAVDSSVALIKHQAERLRNAVLNLLSAVMMFALPAGIGFLMIAREFVTIVLGANWLPSMPIVQAATVAAIVEIPIVVIQTILIRAGYIRALGILLAIQTVVLLSAIYPVFNAFGLAAVVYAKVAVTSVALIVMMIMLSRESKIAVLDYLSVIFRPAIGSAVMFGALYLAETLVHWGDLPMMILKVAVGGIVYGVVVMSLWFMTGRPDGAERIVWEQAIQRLAPDE